MTKYPEKILLVDDDTNLLSAFKRQFREKYNLDTAEGAVPGLESVEEAGPYAVIVADMRMPDMNGIQFLTRVHEINKETVRIMLTGNADIETAMHAVNEANIFRFLTKPCHKTTFEWAVEAGIEQYRLITAERDLLEKTLNGGIQVLTDILGLVNPVAFSKSSRLREYASHIADYLKIEKAWQVELAALLSQIGCITVPPITLQKYFAGDSLTPEEEKTYNSHPKIGGELLEQIPRMEAVTYMIKNQQKDVSEFTLNGESYKDDFSVMGAQILKVVIDFDLFLSRGFPRSQAIGEMRKRSGSYNPEIFEALTKIESLDVEMVTKVVKIVDLDNTMVLAENVVSRNQVLVAAEGQKVTMSMRHILRNYYDRNQIADAIRVNVPTRKTMGEKASVR